MLRRWSFPERVVRAPDRVPHISEARCGAPAWLGYSALLTVAGFVGEDEFGFLDSWEFFDLAGDGAALAVVGGKRLGLVGE